MDTADPTLSAFWRHELGPNCRAYCLYELRLRRRLVDFLLHCLTLPKRSATGINENRVATPKMNEMRLQGRSFPYGSVYFADVS